LKCDSCGKEIAKGEEFSHQGQTLCDDCYMDIRFKPKACDPWAVRLATSTREHAGISAEEGLTETQKGIYAFIKSKGKVTAEEVAAELKISLKELEREFAILRHCELVKGIKEDDKVYLALFD